jgi:hypothetical protein
MNEDQIISDGPIMVSHALKTIVEELDEIIDIDKEQKELNMMFMDENIHNL